jgi:hypothetical protein
MAKQTDVDWGGLDLIVNGIKMGATKPGQAGTELSSTELGLINGVTAGTAIASKAVTTDANIDVAGLNVVGIARIDWDSATSTLSSNAATITKWAAVVTTEALTTAAGASQAFTITKTGVAAGDIVMVQAVGGTNTRKHIVYEAVCTTNTVTVTVYNIGPTNAVNGTLIFNVLIHKA